MEWEADFFASCLLMPRSMVYEAWNERFGALEVIEHENHDHGSYGRRAARCASILCNASCHDISADQHACPFLQLLRDFARLFRVSVQAMRIRLEQVLLLIRSESASILREKADL